MSFCTLGLLPFRLGEITGSNAKQVARFQFFYRLQNCGEVKLALGQDIVNSSLYSRPATHFYIDRFTYIRNCKQFLVYYLKKNVQVSRIRVCQLNTRPLHPWEKAPRTHLLRGWVGPTNVLDSCKREIFLGPVRARATIPRISSM
jgi:hypothetical protein